MVDFADIQKEFDKTNREYFEELKSELGDDVKNYENMFKSMVEIDKEIEDIKIFYLGLIQIILKFFHNKFHK